MVQSLAGQAGRAKADLTTNASSGALSVVETSNKTSTSALDVRSCGFHA